MIVEDRVVMMPRIPPNRAMTLEESTYPSLYDDVDGWKAWPKLLAQFRTFINRAKVLSPLDKIRGMSCGVHIYPDICRWSQEKSLVFFFPAALFHHLHKTRFFSASTLSSLSTYSRRSSLFARRYQAAAQALFQVPQTFATMAVPLSGNNFLPQSSSFRFSFLSPRVL